MRSSFKLSLASLAAVALFAGMAMAQDKPEMKVNLTLRNAFQNATVANEFKIKNDGGAAETDKFSTSESGFRDDWQSDFTLSYNSSKLAARALIRFRDEGSANAGGSVGPNASRTDIYWKATDSFQLGFLGRTLGGFPGTAVAYGVYGGTVTGGAGMLAGGTVGPVGFYSDTNGIDLRFSSGAISAGLAIIDSCVPACGYKATSQATFNTAANQPKVDFTGSKADGTYIPYFQGAFGDLTLGAYMSSASAKVAEAQGGTAKFGDGKNADVKDKDGNSASASLLDVNLKYMLGQIGLAFEYWNQSQSCITKVAKNCSAQVQGAIVLGAAIPAGPGTLKAHYVSISQTASLAKDVDFTTGIADMLVEYAIPMTAEYKLVPLYGSRVTTTEEKVKGAYKLDGTQSNSMIALGMRADF